MEISVHNETLASYFSRFTNELIAPTNLTNLVFETQEEDQKFEMKTWIIICVLTFFCGLVTAMALRFRASSFSFSKSKTITSISIPTPQGPDSPPPPHISHTTSESLHSSRKVFLKSSSDSRESVRKRYHAEYQKSQSCRESVVDSSRRKSGFVDQNNASVRRSANLHQAPSLQRLGSPRNGTSPRQKFGSDFTKQTLSSPKAGFNKIGSDCAKSKSSTDILNSSSRSPRQHKVTCVKDKPLLYE